MLFKNFHIMFIMFVFSGTIMAVSTNSWFMAWLGLEINLMGFIPLILIKLNSFSSEAAIKYFLAQAMASVMLILGAVSENSSLYSFSANSFNLLIMTALIIKAGMAPFHFWFPQVMLMSNWFQCVLILIWQKIAPFILLSYFFNSIFISLISMTCVFIGCLGGLNQISLKLILTYSSIVHSGWMLLLTSLSYNNWLNYFLIYSIISLSIIYPLYNLNVEFLSEVYSSSSSTLLKLGISFSILSLGGLPPFLGFMAKLMALKNLFLIASTSVLFVLVVSSLFSLFYYIKMIYNFSMMFNYQFNSNFRLIENKINMWMIFSITGNCILSSMVLLT